MDNNNNNNEGFFGGFILGMILYVVFSFIFELLKDFICAMWMIVVFLFDLCKRGCIWLVEEIKRRRNSK